VYSVQYGTHLQDRDFTLLIYSLFERTLVAKACILTSCTQPHPPSRSSPAAWRRGHRWPPHPRLISHAKGTKNNSFNRTRTLYLGGTRVDHHGRTGRGGHGLPKVLLGLAIPDPSTPCRRVTPETVILVVAHPRVG
jgi:hypothetical protein